ncbi:MAG: hypothetical protein Q7T78_07140 [Rhodoferax sp.]|nr:hypothetical protein [Rhodoferax sp.]
MPRKKLILMLIAAGLVLAATSAAFSLYLWNWLANDSPVDAGTPPVAVPAPTSAAEPPVPPASR